MVKAILITLFTGSKGELCACTGSKLSTGSRLPRTTDRAGYGDEGPRERRPLLSFVLQPELDSGC